MYAGNQQAAETAPPMRVFLVLVAVAAFATAFTQAAGGLANDPILFHLKERLHFSKEQVSEFFLWATFAGSVKPLAGVLIDAFPIRGSRRRIYLLAGAVLAALSWAGLDVVRDRFTPFLVVAIAAAPDVQ